jgi:uncharacterized coiled-coil DUF342 family protein
MNKKEGKKTKLTDNVFDLIKNIDLKNIEKTIEGFGLLYKEKENELRSKMEVIEATFEGYKQKVKDVNKALEEYSKLNDELRAERDAFKEELEKVKKERDTISEAYTNLFNQKSVKI